MWNFIKSDKMVRFWGICDILYFAWYLTNSFIKGNLPFFHDIAQMLKSTKSFENPLPLIIGMPAIALYLSLPFSGKLLYQLNKKGAIVSYIQTPFRFLVVSPSLFFIYWPISFLYDEPATSALIFGGALVLISETFKLFTIISWHMKHRKKIITNQWS